MIAPSGSVTPGKIRAPRVMTLSAPTVTPSPSTAPPLIELPTPMLQPAATTQSRSVHLAATVEPFRITERSTVVPLPGT